MTTPEDPSRKATVVMPAASNVVLQEERLRRLEAMAERWDGAIEKFDTLMSKVDLALGKLDAHRTLLLNESRKREENDEKLGVSLDRLSFEIHAVAVQQGKHAMILGEVRALAVAAVDGVAGLGVRVTALESPSAETPTHAAFAG